MEAIGEEQKKENEVVKVRRLILRIHAQKKDEVKKQLADVFFGDNPDIKKKLDPRFVELLCSGENLSGLRKK